MGTRTPIPDVISSVCEDYNPALSAEIDNGRAVTPFPVCLHGVVINCIINYGLTLPLWIIKYGTHFVKFLYIFQNILAVSVLFCELVKQYMFSVKGCYLIYSSQFEGPVIIFCLYAVNQSEVLHQSNINNLQILYSAHREVPGRNRNI
jgi:hypothetical protein